MDALKLALERAFLLRLVQFLRNQFPDAVTAPQKELEAGVERQIKQARGHGFLAEQDIATYVTSAWLLGEEFDREFPAVAEVLESISPVDEKANWLEQFTETIFRELEKDRKSVV